MPLRPVVVLADAPLTDFADAYLIDPTVVDRVVVVAALGSYSAPNGVMGVPNGDLDAWASWIVAQRFRYVQVGVWYDQSNDVPDDPDPELADESFRELDGAPSSPRSSPTSSPPPIRLRRLSIGLAASSCSGRCAPCPTPAGGFDSQQGSAAGAA